MNAQKPLGIKILFVLFLLAGLLGAGGQFLRTRFGLSAFILPYTLTATLAILGMAVLFCGLRIRAKLNAKEKKPVNPFQAVRILITARAAQITGCVFAGLAGGLILGFVARDVWPQSQVWLPTLFGLVSAIFLVACGKITELMCRIPPGDDAEDDDSPSSKITRPDAVLGCDEKP